MYPEATIDPDSYERNIEQLEAYLTTPIDMEILANFLRQHSPLQKCFQVRQERHGGHRYIEAEKVYAYEHGSSYRVSDETRDKLLEEIDAYEYFPEPLEGRIVLNTFEDFFRQNPNLDLRKEKDLALLLDAFSCTNAKARNVGQLLVEFCHIQPRLPEEKRFTPSKPVELKAEWGRDRVMEELEGMRDTHPVVDLAFYAYRDLTRTDWQPYVKAALERNPVVVDALRNDRTSKAVETLQQLTPESIYDGNRLAQPDEVWNFQRGDGAEVAFAIAAVLKHRKPDRPVDLHFNGDTVRVAWDDRSVDLKSVKGLKKELTV